MIRANKKKLKKMDEEIREENVKKEEDGVRWSIKRIAIFITFLTVLLFLLYLFVQSRVENVLGERSVEVKSEGPQIELPTKNTVDEILRNAQENISQIDPNDIVGSQPQIQSTIDELKKLTSQENIKGVICSLVCSD